MDGKIAVLIPAKLHNELVLRTRKVDDVSATIENVLRSFLERTAGDADLWHEEYAAEFAENSADSWTREFGDPNKGYLWSILFLPNGSRLKMNYKGRDHFVEVKHARITEGAIEYSPSEWASKVANHTSRNAWRDIYIQFPQTSEWKLADVLRLRAKEGLPL